MRETLRLRPSSRVLRIALCGVLLLTFSSAFFGADYPNNALTPKRGTPVRTFRPANTAKEALFEQNDAARARKLAARALQRDPRDVDNWFVLGESAALQGDRQTEIRAALAVCRLATQGDPRAIAAAGHLASFGQNSATFRRQRVSFGTLSTGNSVCASGALQALYEAALDGSNSGDVLELAHRAGWQIRWTVSRTGAAGAKFIPEKFEFLDARLQLPDYFPRAASYTATTTYSAPETGDYLIAGDTTGAALFIDDRAAEFGRSHLEGGEHSLRIVFRPEDSTPRIKIASLAGFGNLRWTRLGLLPRESVYLQAAVALAAGSADLATELLEHSGLSSTALGMNLLDRTGDGAPRSTVFESVLTHPSCGNLQAAIKASQETANLARELQSCAPDSLTYAHWLASADRHGEAIEELNRVIHDWPLDREARRMLIAELQRTGDPVAADRAAADFLAIAPNAHDFRRMAKNAKLGPGDAGVPFYESYRRPAPAVLPAFETSLSPAIILLQDKVAVAREDGSVSLYVHRVVELMTSKGAHAFKPLAIPEGAQLLKARVVNNDATLDDLVRSSLKAQDEIEEEYVVNYTGDGGMIAHSEAFQYVFNDFDFPLLSARFVVLSPSKESPGYVIASGSVPELQLASVNGFCAQIWEQDRTSDARSVDPGIVRVVENENGWSIPPSVERRRNLETIHPGPRPREA